MIKNVFLSNSIKEEKKSLIKEYLDSLGEEFRFVCSDLSSNSLRIVSDNEIYLQNRLKVPTVTFIGLRAVIEHGMNPYQLKPTDKIKNLLLIHKSVAFHNSIDTKTRSQLSRSVVLMGGSITDAGRRPDYCIGNPSLILSNQNTYYTPDWIVAMENSTHFIDPKQFMIQQISPKKTVSSQVLLSAFDSPSRINPLVIVQSQSSAESQQQIRLFSQEFSQRTHSRHGSPISKLPSQRQSQSSCIVPPPEPVVYDIEEPAEEDEDKEKKIEETEKQHVEENKNPEKVEKIVNEQPKKEEKEKPPKVDISSIRKMINLRLKENQNANVNSPTEKKVINFDNVIQFTQKQIENDDSEEEVIDYEQETQQPPSQSQYFPSQDPLLNALS